MLILLHNGAVFSTDTYPATYPAPDCQEDQPCWSCSTMGNLQCGPTTTTTAAVTTSTTVPAKSGLPVTGGDIGGLVLIGLGAGLIGTAIVRAAKRQKINK